MMIAELELGATRSLSLSMHNHEGIGLSRSTQGGMADKVVLTSNIPRG